MRQLAHYFPKYPESKTFIVYRHSPSMALNVGDSAPDFELPDTDLKMRKLEEFVGEKKVVLTFIVAASSPVCETELCTLRDAWQEISDAGAQVIAVSNDGPFANKAFAAANRYTFPFLSDYNSKTIADYGILMKDLLHIKDYNAAKRSVFVINEDGKIGYKWITDNPLEEPNYDEIKEYLRK